MIYTLGPYIHCNPVLLAKVMRLGKAFIKERISSKSVDNHSQGKVRSSVLSCMVVGHVLASPLSVCVNSFYKVEIIFSQFDDLLLYLLIVYLNILP